MLSSKGSWTDFHIDFGGSSVFYHIISGTKIFYVIEPTKEALDIYEEWCNSPKRENRFLGDSVKCSFVVLKPGNTFLIPSGWIHAVYTPEDSLVIGGNFLHTFNIVKQLEVYELEKRTNVPIQFTFPMFEDINLYAIEYYCKFHSRPLTPVEIQNLVHLVGYFMEKRYSDNRSVAETRHHPSVNNILDEASVKFLQMSSKVDEKLIKKGKSK